MDTSENITCKLHWEVEGYTPIPEPDEKIAILEQVNIDKDQEVIELKYRLKIAER